MATMKPVKRAPSPKKVKKGKQTESAKMKGGMPYERARGQKTRS